MELVRRQGEHVLIIGPTGSGKSYFAQRFVRGFPFAVALDVKDELKWRGFSRVTNTSLTKMENLQASHIIYAPKPRDYLECANHIFELAYEMEGWMVYVDEVYSLGHTYTQVPASFPDLLTRGRSKGITVITATQRPRFLPLFCFTESKHFYIFRVQSALDLKVIREQATPEVASLVAKLHKYEFVYYNKESGEAVIAKPIR